MVDSLRGAHHPFMSLPFMSSSSRKYMSKRQRPCDFCRSRKTACRIEGRVPCRLCLQHGRQCTFNEAAQPRKRLPQPARSEEPSCGPESYQTNDNDGTYTNVLTGRSVQPEIARTSELSERTSRTTALSESLVSGMSNQDFMFGNLAEQFLSQFADAAPDFDFGPTYSVAGEEQSPGGFHAGLELQESPDHLEGYSNASLDACDGLNPQILGYSGDMDPYLLQSYRYDALGTFKFKQLSIHSVCHGNTPTQFLISQPGLFTLSRQEMGLRQDSADIGREVLQTLVPASTGSRLIGLLRRFILPHYPIFSETDFPDPQISPHYLLAAIYMIAQPFAKFDDVLSIELAYEDLNSQGLFKLVHEALQFEAHNPSLAAVQTMLLLILRPSSNPLILEASVKWSLHGALVATAQTLGLHYNPSSWNIPSWQIALRRRLSCTIFTVDKWLACSLGRPPLITRDSWLVTTLTSEDNQASSLGLELWHIYMHHAHLGAILADVLLRLYSIRAISDFHSNIHSVVDISKELIGRLSHWHQDLSQLETDVSEEMSALQAVSTLGYHYVHMTIFRAIAQKSHATTNAATELLQADQQGILDFASQNLRSATTAAAGFVKSLQQGHFHMFWPQWSQVAFSCICFLDLMMAVSSPNAQDATAWFRDLHIARREMRLKSNMLPVLRLGLLRIDAIFWKGVDKVLHLQPHVQQAFRDSMDQVKI